MDSTNTDHSALRDEAMQSLLKKRLNVTSKYQPIQVQTLKDIRKRLIDLVEKSKLTDQNGNYENSEQNGKSTSSNQTKFELINKLNTLCNDTEQVLSFAHDFDSAQISGNGYFSFVKLSFRLLQTIEHNLKPSDNSNTDLTTDFDTFLNQILDMYLFLSKLILEQREMIMTNGNQPDIIYDASNGLRHWILNDIEMKSDDNHNSITSRSLFTYGCEKFKQVVQKSNQLQDVRISIMDHFGVFWLDRSMENFFMLYSFLLALNKLDLPQSYRCLKDRSFRMNKFLELVRKPGFEMPFKIWNYTENFLYRSVFINLFNLRVPATSKTVFIPRQQKIFIDKDGLTFNKDKQCLSAKHNEDQVRCRLTIPLNSKNQSFDQLALHVHGGGFVSHSPDSHEIYLRIWSEQIQVPILSIDYSLCQPFPTALQECFDVYHWLRTSTRADVIDLLGFYPKQIVLVGDSAGANLSLSLSIFLHHLHTEHKSSIPSCLGHPDGMLGIYGAYLLVPYISPSRILSSVDHLINPEILIFLMTVYSGVTKPSEPKPWYQAWNPFAKQTDEIELWNEKGEQTFDIEQVLNVALSPFVSPLLYQHLDKMTDFPLYMITCEFCPFLDETVSIAKYWKGRKHLDVLPDLNHGFLNFNMLSARAQDGVDLCSQRLIELFNQIKSK